MTIARSSTGRFLSKSGSFGGIVLSGSSSGKPTKPPRGKARRAYSVSGPWYFQRMGPKPIARSYLSLPLKPIPDYQLPITNARLPIPSYERHFFEYYRYFYLCHHRFNIVGAPIQLARSRTCDRHFLPVGASHPRQFPVARSRRYNFIRLAGGNFQTKARSYPSPRSRTLPSCPPIGNSRNQLRPQRLGSI